MKQLWPIRILFLTLCVVGGFAISQAQGFSSVEHREIWGMVAGFGFGGLLIAVDEMLKGFSLRAFSSTTFGLLLGSLVALLVDRSGLFDGEDANTRQLIRIALFVSVGYIGMVLAMRSNKEDFSLIIPYVRFSPQNKPDNLLILDTSVIIDGRIADLIETRLIEGLIIVPRFVLLELQQIADSADDIKRSRGRRGFEMLNRLQQNTKMEVRIHDGDFPEEKSVDAKIVRLARNLNAKLFTSDSNLAKVAALQNVVTVNLREVAFMLKAAMVPGETVHLKLVREGRDKGQGIGYLPDGTMVIVTNGQALVGQHVEAHVQSTVQTGAGVLVFAEARLDGTGDTAMRKREEPPPPK